ncbi:MAG TPA: DUF4367 domain-containing protein [Mobilitalea sp.]|nr:DUF4367 domain-containing protein [Mobilitalea sp.]
MNNSIHTDREYQQELEDVFLRHIGYEYTQLICEEQVESEQEWKNIQIPEELDWWFGDFTRLEEKKRKSKARNLRLLKHLKRAAIFLLFLVGVNFILVSSVEAYRVKWLNTVSSIKEKFIQIDTIEESTDSSDNIPKDWGGKYYLTYLPAGYKLLQTVVDDDFPILIYTNQNGNNIVFQQIQQGSSVRVDSENGKVTNVIINDNQEAFLIEKGSERTLNWLQGDMAFHLEAHKLELPEFIQMAESIVIKNN